jgi:hypothetical protein
MRVAQKFRAKQACYSNNLYAFVVLQVKCSYRVQLGRLSGGVPAIVFGYPRHSEATDEGMTNGPPIFAYLVFGPGRVSHERLSRPIKAVAWRGPGAILGVQARF